MPSPKRLRGVVGSGERDGGALSPHTWPATAMARKKTLRVATTRTSAEAWRSRDMTSTWVGTPSRAGTPMAPPRRAPATTPVAGRPVVDEGADHREGALGEVDDARASIDEDESLPGQRVDGADAETEQDEAEELVQVTRRHEVVHVEELAVARRDDLAVAGPPAPGR